MPFVISTDSAYEGALLPKQSLLSLCDYMAQRFCEYVYSRCQIRLLFKVQGLNVHLLRCSVAIRNQRNLAVKPPPAYSEQRSERKAVPAKPTSLVDLPLELMIMIFDYVAQDTEMRAVGHYSCNRDSFYFKNRGISLLPLVFT